MAKQTADARMIKLSEAQTLIIRRLTLTKNGEAWYTELVHSPNHGSFKKLDTLGLIEHVTEGSQKVRLTDDGREYAILQGWIAVDDSAPAPMNKDADDIHAQAAICEHGIKHAHCAICTPDGGFIRAAQAAPDEPASGDVVAEYVSAFDTVIIELMVATSRDKEPMVSGRDVNRLNTAHRNEVAALTAELAALRTERDSLLDFVKRVAGVKDLFEGSVIKSLEPTVVEWASEAQSQAWKIINTTRKETDATH